MQSHNHTATRVPARPVVDSLPLRRKPRWLKQPTGLFLRATFRIHNHLPPKQKKDIPFGMSFCFGGRWWIRTTEVIDDRFTVCSLWPLGKPSIFDYQLDWSWWTDLNPRPADYKSAALPTELHQHTSSSTAKVIITEGGWLVKPFFAETEQMDLSPNVETFRFFRTNTASAALR